MKWGGMNRFRKSAAVLRRAKCSLAIRAGFDDDLPAVSTAKQSRAEQQRAAEGQRGQGKAPVQGARTCGACCWFLKPWTIWADLTSETT